MLKKINDCIFRVIGVFAAACLFAIVVLVSAQVFSRYVFGFSIKWTSELTVYALTWMVFMGCSMGYRKGAIIGLTMVVDRLPKKVNNILAIIVTLVLMFFFVVTFISNLTTVQNAAGRLSSIMHINLAFVAVAWNVASAIMFLFSIERLIDQVKALIHPDNGGNGLSEEVSA